MLYVARSTRAVEELRSSRAGSTLFETRQLQPTPGGKYSRHPEAGGSPCGGRKGESETGAQLFWSLAREGEADVGHLRSWGWGWGWSTRVSCEWRESDAEKKGRPQGALEGLEDCGEEMMVPSSESWPRRNSQRLRDLFGLRNIKDWGGLLCIPLPS